MQKLILMLAPLLMAAKIFSQANAGTEKYPAIRPTFSAAFLTGGQATTKTFYFNSGFGVYSTIQTDREKRVSAGVGAGFEKLENEIFFPFFAELKGRLSATDPGGYLMVQGGYAPASSQDYEHYSGYDFSGGALFAAGWGYSWPIAKSLLGLSLLYRHQYARQVYTGAADFKVTDRLSYSFLMVRTSFEF